MNSLDSSKELTDYLALGARLMDTLQNYCMIPVIAAVEGYALGGGFELALGCDLIVASHSSVFGFPETQLGLIPGFGGTQRLLLRAGIGQTKRLIFSGERISAEDAHKYGVIDQIFSDDDFNQNLDSLIEKIASKSPSALKKTKQVVNLTVNKFQSEGLKKEVNLFKELFASSDREEGFKAFIEKRSPDFD